MEKYMTGNVYGNISQRSLYAETYKCEVPGLALGGTSQKGSEHIVIVFLTFLSLEFRF